MHFDSAQCKQRGSAQLLVIFVILLLVVGGVYFFESRKNTREPIVQYNSSNNYDNYEIYSNSSLGFSFNYQKDLQVIEDSEEEYNKRGNGDYRKNFTGYVGYQPPPFGGAVVVMGKDNNFDSNPLSVWIFNNDSNLTIEQWFDKYWYYPFVWGVFDYTSKGHIALDQEATVSGEIAKSKIVSYQPGKPKFVYIAKNQRMYLFRIIDDEGKTGEKILSSFKFLPVVSEGKGCGGFAGETGEAACPSGYKCQYPKPMYPDAQGKCVKK